MIGLCDIMVSSSTGDIVRLAGSIHALRTVRTNSVSAKSHQVPLCGLVRRASDGCVGLATRRSEAAAAYAAAVALLWFPRVCPKTCSPVYALVRRQGIRR